MKLLDAKPVARLARQVEKSFPLLDYASERRPAGLELERHIKAEFLKKSALVGRFNAR